MTEFDEDLNEKEDDDEEARRKKKARKAKRLMDRYTSHEETTTSTKEKEKDKRRSFSLGKSKVKKKEEEVALMISSPTNFKTKTEEALTEVVEEEENLWKDEPDVKYISRFLFFFLFPIFFF